MMPSISVQFHMMFEELLEFIDEVRSRYSLVVELERWFPKTSREVPSNADLAEEIDRLGGVDRIWLVYRPSRSRKVEKFMLNVGRLRGSQLQQAQLGAGTDKTEAYEVLKRLARDLKKRTVAGVWVVTETGNVGYDKKFRVSPKAAQASREGEIELVGVAFTQSFRVDAPDGYSARE